jgi:hypothetical protein
LRKYQNEKNKKKMRKIEMDKNEEQKWNDLQVIVNRWAMLNFHTDAHPHIYMHPLLGIIEEYCELHQALSTGDYNEIEDAVGDVMIFMADFCSLSSYNLATIVYLSDDFCTDSKDAPLNSTKYIRLLVHHQLKLEQGIRGTAAAHSKAIEITLARMVADLRMCAKDISLLDITLKIFSKVGKRDWKTNPRTGESIPCEENE